MPYCTQCGSEMAEAAICPSCQSPEPVPAPPSSSRYELKFVGSGAPMLWIYLVTFLLSILTLGIYYFWGRTRIRRYILSMTELDGERFAWHGTGGELLIGWLKALVVLAILIGQYLLFMLGLGTATGEVMGTIILYAGFMMLMPVALVGAWRYRFSRTSYRGLRFAFRGRVMPFFKLYVAGSLLTIITFGIYFPVFASKIQRFFCRHTFYGTARFDYDGKDSALVGPWLLALLLFIPTLGLSLLWFTMRQANYQWSYSSFAGARFRPSYTFSSYFFLIFTNLLLVVFTLGIGYPWAEVRGLRYMCSRLPLEGVIDFASIQQRAADATATGEEMSDMFDADAMDIGLGF
ncbi:MAG: DUF898 domain-containing protein [Acidimicrobiia bacterium]|nr:DUF898 domain-containing protein [Acidimicrobiia bacterium]